MIQQMDREADYRDRRAYECVRPGVGGGGTNVAGVPELALQTEPYSFGRNRQEASCKAISLSASCPSTPSQSTYMGGTPWKAVLTSAGPPLTTPALCSILLLLGHHCFGNHSLEGTLERRYCSPSLCSTVGKRKPFRSSYGSDQNTPEAAENINRWSSFSFLTTSF